MEESRVVVGTRSKTDRRTKIGGVLLIIAGVLAILAPFVAGIAVTAAVGWLLLLAAGAHLLYSWHSRSAGAVIWQLIIGILYVWVAFYLIFHPARGLATLTLLLAFYFAIEGIMEIIMYFQLRRSYRAGWFLLDGLITFFLGVLIWAHWPSSTVWVLGTVVGISLLISGIARLYFRSTRLVPGQVGVA